VEDTDVATIIHDDYHVPEYVINQTTDERLLNLLPQLKSQVIGQDTALEKVAMKLTNREAGLADTSKPESFLFSRHCDIDCNWWDLLLQHGSEWLSRYQELR